MKTTSRAVMRGKPLDDDCRIANISKHEYGQNDNRCFCYGLYVPCNDWEIQQKCRECKAYVDNAEPPKDGDTEEHIEVSRPDGNCLDCKFQYLEDSDYWCSKGKIHRLKGYAMYHKKDRVANNRAIKEQEEK